MLLRLGLHYLPATAIAIEAALLQNFYWHERWTWRDRPATGTARWRRFGRFHVLNGVVSFAGNLAIMRVLVGAAGLAPLPANILAVMACALINFTLSEWLVFDSPIADCRLQIADCKLTTNGLTTND